jgi:ABC-type molybdate transport system substrate-binding protein
MALNNGRVKLVTQATSAVTGVTAHGYEGIITTFALATAAGASETFTITNKKVQRITEIQVALQYAGAGAPIVRIQTQARGSFSVTITNVSAATALNAVAKVHFSVIHN